VTRLGIVALLALCGAVWASAALGAVPVQDCPPGPTSPYGGPDPVVSQLDELRYENSASCVAVAERLDYIAAQGHDTERVLVWVWAGVLCLLCYPLVAVSMRIPG